MRVLTLSAVAASLIVAGCTTDPMTGQRDYNKTAIGALAGAAAGYGISKSSANTSAQNNRAAAIGAVLGGGIGLYMDKQEKQLRQDMAGTGVEVQKDAATGALNLVMPGNITFATDSSNIAPQFTGTLSDVAGVLKQYDKTTIVVEGHTDSTGAASYNQNLSVQRASSVANYLSSMGVASNRLQVMGMGESQPIASNDTEAGKAQNRRVEIRIMPPASL